MSDVCSFEVVGQAIAQSKFDQVMDLIENVCGDSFNCGLRGYLAQTIVQVAEVMGDEDVSHVLAQVLEGMRQQQAVEQGCSEVAH